MTLTVKPFLRDEKISVADSEGNSISEGDTVELVRDTIWHKAGEVVRVTGARYGSLEISLEIESYKNSRTSIPANAARVVDQQKEFELDRLQYEWWRLGEVISSAEHARNAIAYQIRKLKADL